MALNFPPARKSWSASPLGKLKDPPNLQEVNRTKKELAELQLQVAGQAVNKTQAGKDLQNEVERLEAMVEDAYAVMEEFIAAREAPEHWKTKFRAVNAGNDNERSDEDRASDVTASSA